MNFTLLYPDFKSKAVTFSYDDGVIQDREVVAILNQHHLRGTFNLIYGKSGAGKTRNGIDCSHLDLTANLGLYEGHEVANHTFSHPHLEGLPYEVQFSEYEKNKTRLERLFCVSVYGSAYPFGTYDATTLQVLSDLKIHYARATQSTYAFHRPYSFLLWQPTIHHNDPLLKATLNRFFASEDELALFYLWGHGYEFALSDNFALLDHFCGDIDLHPEIYNSTNEGLYVYLSAAEMLYYRDGAFVNPSKLPVYLRVKDEKILVPPLSRYPFEEQKA